MKRNPLFATLSKQYLFQEIQTKARAFQTANPDKKILSLGIGDTTQPLAPSVAHRLVEASRELGNPETYVGYGPEVGDQELRERIASILYPGTLSRDEIFISDGVKSDLIRLLLLCTEKASIAIQDPTYPAYFDAARIARNAQVTLLPCSKGAPDLTKAPKGSLVFLCSPNNPTGEAFTKAQYEEIISSALERRLCIILDVAYREFIRGDLPRSIYEIEGGKKVAVELGSFSKMAGFSGVRLGWSVVPKELCYDDKSSVHADFLRLFTSTFNGAGILSQKGGIQALSPKGQQEVNSQIASYMEQTRLLRNALMKKSFSVVGGEQAPYVWVKMDNRSSWDAFDYLLETLGIIVTPGIGFGPGGEGFVRFSGLAAPKTVSEAISRLQSL